MLSPIEHFMENMRNRDYARNIVGPLMMGLGIFLLVLMRTEAQTPGILQVVIFTLAGFLIAGGSVITYLGVIKPPPSVSGVVPSSADDLSLAVQQLSQNYEWARNQTISAFYVSTIFMALGLLVILFGSIRVILNLSASTDNLTIIAGIIAEFISGSALVLYRSSSKRLNKISEDLHGTWRIMAAYKLTKDLPKAIQKDAMIPLISALAGLPLQIQITPQDKAG